MNWVTANDAPNHTGERSSEKLCSGNGTIFNTEHEGLPVCVMNLAWFVGVRVPLSLVWWSLPWWKGRVAIPLSGQQLGCQARNYSGTSRHIPFPNAVMGYHRLTEPLLGLLQGCRL